jgi:hypothetical protein
MNRTAWLQDRRMQKFRDVLSRVLPNPDNSWAYDSAGLAS